MGFQKGYEFKYYELGLVYCTCFGSTYTKIGTIQRRLAWPLRKDDTQNREAFHIFRAALTKYKDGNLKNLYLLFYLKTLIVVGKK